MSQQVWVTANSHLVNVRQFGVSFPGVFDYLAFYPLDRKKKQERTDAEQAEWLSMMQACVKISKQYNNFKKLDPAIIPTTLYGHNIRTDIELPAFCSTEGGGGIIFLNEQCAALLKQFRLGETVMYPVSFFDVDHHQLVNDQRYYILNIAEWRHYLLPEQSSKHLSKEANKNDGYQAYWLYYEQYKSGAIALSERAVQCDLDLWHDPALIGSIFMSNALKQALDQAGMAPDWLFYQCQLILDILIHPHI